MSKDYIFHIKWEDRHKIPHKVGLLAKIDDKYYLMAKDEQQARVAYASGFKGIPGFNPDEIYVSENKLFDFFERRALATNPEEQCKELAETGGTSFVDSFSVEEICGRRIQNKYKKNILDAYDIQLKLEEKHRARQATMAR